jgi:hypothetical protein
MYFGYGRESVKDAVFHDELVGGAIAQKTTCCFNGLRDRLQVQPMVPCIASGTEWILMMFLYHEGRDLSKRSIALKYGEQFLSPLWGYDHIVVEKSHELSTCGDILPSR